MYCEKYEDVHDAVIELNGMDFVPNAEIPNGDELINILDHNIQDIVVDLRGCLDLMIFGRALTGCLEESDYVMASG